jgi:7,8-dihydropterin-6-yl-methyl-4-(beta-D-ribofuranosyl)aminobenzene 5'-phosphate synthase
VSSRPELKGVDIYIVMDDKVESTGLQKEKGLSILIEAHYPKKDLNILFDTSISGRKVLSNAEKMNLDLSKISYIVLSHKHWDHTGGLLEILKARTDWVPILHGQKFFKPSIAIDPYLRHTTKMPFLRKKITELKGMLTPIWIPVEFAPEIFLSGKIQLVTEFEAPPSKYKILPQMAQDEMEEELSLIINLKGELIIISGCSHRGVVNTVKNAISVTKNSKIRAIVGGLHLMAVSEKRISRTVEELSKLGVKEFYIGHCTGDKALRLFKSNFGDAVYRTRSGMIFTF